CSRGDAEDWAECSLENTMTAPTSALRLPSPRSSSYGRINDAGWDSRKALVESAIAGLTLGVALAAALAGALLASEVVLRTIVAAIATGAVAIGFGAYVNGRFGARRMSERANETRRMAASSNGDRKEVVELLARYGIEAKESSPIVSVFAHRPAAWMELAARFECR